MFQLLKSMHMYMYGIHLILTFYTAFYCMVILSIALLMVVLF